ncbi:hypothetical protein F4777DRAFT_463765 [Nemania sp. FL0916]|nr:hypothetical protein F4777DRAFT_463765 [Nemania sp. FL0916]
METPQELTVSLKLRLRKSRHGCRTCKQRKIKCDEARPVCGNCARRYYDVERCDYPLASATHRRTRQSGSDSESAESPGQPALLSPGIVTRPASISSDHSQRQLEMRLMYHYTQFTAMQLPATYGYSSKELWLDRVPQMAFESDLLLDSVLTVAALHMQDLMPEDHKLGMAVNHYLDRTLAKHRHSLGCIENTLAEPLFLTAFMLCITSWQISHRKSAASEMYRIPSNVFALVRGCCALHRQYDGWLARAGYDPGAVWFTVPGTNFAETDHPLLQEVREDVANLLEAFHVNTMPPDEASAYEDTAGCVVNLYEALVAQESNTILQRLVFTMAVRMKSRYDVEVAMLEAGQPLALALYARILAVLGFIEHLWWSRGPLTHNRDVLHYSINGISNMMPLRSSWAMEWPLKVVSGEIKLTV